MAMQDFPWMSLKETYPADSAVAMLWKSSVAPRIFSTLSAWPAVWVADPLGARVFRVLEGGEVTDTIDFTDCIPVACVLGGPDRRTLLMCVAADWKRDALEGTRTGRILATDVDVPGAGRP